MLANITTRTEGATSKTPKTDKYIHTTPIISKGQALLRMKELQEWIGLSRASIYSRISPTSPVYDPLFPRPIKYGEKGTAVFFLAEDVQAWLDSRLQTR